MNDKRTNKLVKKAMKTLSLLTQTFPIDDDSDTDTDSLPLEVGKVIEPLDEERIRKKLTSAVLSLELANRFPELFQVRESVILRSHCINHLITYDPNAPFEDIPGNDEDSLVMASGINLTDIDHLKAILAGMRSKRLNVVKGEKRVRDDPYRNKFLLFLTQCWYLSGADEKEQDIAKSSMNEKMVNESIHFMEEVIADILSEFIFLRYKECNFGEGLCVVSIY